MAHIVSCYTKLNHSCISYLEGKRIVILAIVLKFRVSPRLPIKTFPSFHHKQHLQVMKARGSSDGQ